MLICFRNVRIVGEVQRKRVVAPLNAFIKLESPDLRLRVSGQYAYLTNSLADCCSRR
jgi:hypothetical protein